MLGIGGGEFILILLVVFLLFGPRKLPEIARTLGKGMAQLRKAQTEFQRNIYDVSSEIEETTGQIKKPFSKDSASPSDKANSADISAITEQDSDAEKVKTIAPRPLPESIARSEPPKAVDNNSEPPEEPENNNS